MKNYQKDFVKFVLEQGILRFGKFTLKSGRESPYFFNAGLFDTGEKIAKLSLFYAQAIIDAELSFDMLFGPAYKGIPLVTATVMQLAQTFNRDYPFAFNRKEAKDHGEGGQLVGAALQGRVLIIDDVITAGTAIRESLAILQQHHAQLAGVIVALDRQERGAGETSAIQDIEAAHQVPVVSIIRFADLISFLQQQPVLQEHLPAMLRYRETFGVSTN